MLDDYHRNTQGTCVSSPVYRSLASPGAAYAARRLCTLICASLLFIGCSDSREPQPVADPAGTDNNRTLTIIKPTGGEIASAVNERVALSVRYESEEGLLIHDEPVRFALVDTGDGEHTAGASLSTALAMTDQHGIAHVDLILAAESGQFRISADADDAATVYFVVSVSEGGFTRLEVEPAHVGWRNSTELDHVEVRLYSSRILTCADLDIETPPQSSYPSQSLSGFSDAVVFDNVRAGHDHTLVGWAQADRESRPLATGCLDLAGGQLPASRSSLTLSLPLRDREIDWDSPQAIDSAFDTQTIAEVVRQSGAEDAWDILSCPAGPGQLILDCLVDAIADDGALDCISEAGTPMTDAIAARRGALAPNISASGDGGPSCRSATDASEAPTLDAILSAATQDTTQGSGAGNPEGMDPLSWPVGDDAAQLDQVRGELLAGFHLHSTLIPVAETALDHRLDTVAFSASTGAYELDLAMTSRPIIERRGVAAYIAEDRLTIAEHAYPLRYASALAQAFAHLGLAPLGIDADADTLGGALVGAVSDPDSLASGCAAVSAMVCGDIGQAADCVALACSRALPAMDTALSAWIDVLHTDDSDLILSLGTANISDDNGDLLADSLPTGTDDTNDNDGEYTVSDDTWTGTWKAYLRSVLNEDIAISGQFSWR